MLHDIPKNGFNLALPDGKQCFVGKYQIEVQDFQSLLQINPDILLMIIRSDQKKYISAFFENLRTVSSFRYEYNVSILHQLHELQLFLIFRSEIAMHTLLFLIVDLQHLQ